MLQYTNMIDASANAPLNPDDFVISRKRKKYRFAKFANADNCFELEQWQQLAVTRVIIEVGAGTALFLVELATRYPDRQFVALDVKADRLQKGAYEAKERGLRNIYFVRARADQLPEVIAPGSASEIWLTFSDPFPRTSDAKRRLTAPRFLALYRQALSQGGVLKQKTDSHALFDWSLEQLVAQGWKIAELTYDLHDSKMSSDYKIMTTYEHKWQREGLKTHLVSAIAPDA